MKLDIELAKDFILNYWTTCNTTTCFNNGDVMVYKLFKKKAVKYDMTFRFNKHGEFISGMISDENSNVYKIDASQGVEGFIIKCYDFLKQRGYKPKYQEKR